ncbi:MAG: chalcone isomerase family protein [Myxococcales bacterium]|nr:chalcone isomerase family protein [Myxococcales bacterium]MCB9691016.1 chalcone isomerase family protein [Alphaproteobacteria bacterium]
MIQMLMLLTTLAFPTADAAELAGVTMPDSATVAGQKLVLNGMGLREKFFIDVYVGGLYLPAKTTDAKSAIDQDVPKRIKMHFIYSEVDAGKLTGAFNDGFAAVGATESQASGLAKLNGMMETVKAGETITLDYEPGVGTHVSVKGQEKGVIAGVDFMKALWGVYLGPSPPTTALKKGMLGG